MSLRSAGLLVYRRGRGGLEVLLGHPGGPFWKAKDAGAWTIPKGLVEAGEDELAAAIREFAEEIGPAPPGPFEALTPVRTKGGKWVTAWAAEADLDVLAPGGALVELEWPRGSGKVWRFPEIDRAGYFPLAVALEKVLPAQAPLLVELRERLSD
jgi:predicted NUDIX family NTP pyrophosphohydrolase